MFWCLNWWRRGVHGSKRLKIYGGLCFYWPNRCFWIHNNRTIYLMSIFKQNHNLSHMNLVESLKIQRTNRTMMDKFPPKSNRLKTANQLIKIKFSIADKRIRFEGTKWSWNTNIPTMIVRFRTGSYFFSFNKSIPNCIWVLHWNRDITQKYGSVTNEIRQNPI